MADCHPCKIHLFLLYVFTNIFVESLRNIKEIIMLFTNIFIFQINGSKQVGHEIKQACMSNYLCHCYKTESVGFFI